MARLSTVAAISVLPVLSGADTMDCQGAPLCGILTLESGMGKGYYHHKAASVHGLWPETGEYGTSQCIQPQDSSDATSIPDCYNNDEAHADPEHQLEFVNHEWEKHGQCAGARDVKGFFNTVCSLSAHPVALIEKQKESGASFDDMVNAIKDAGYATFSADEGEDQIMLSACACSDGLWKLADPSEFAQKCCGGSGPGPAPPTPSPSGGKCVTGRHGPACSSDGDCEGLSGCLRCARSGYCTDVPISLLV